MRLIEEVEIKLDRFDLANRVNLRRKPLPRSPGVHLSGVLRHIIQESRMPGWQTYMTELEQDHVPLIWFLGIAWEEACVSLYPDIDWQPGECELDGVFMTPDGDSLLEVEGEYRKVKEEFKYTSCKMPDANAGRKFTDDWLKMQQGRGYCAADEDDCRLVRWHVLWNWRPWEPHYSRYLIEFSDADVESTRMMIAANRASAEAAGYVEVGQAA